jgi:hypothetical protein
LKGEDKPDIWIDCFEQIDGNASGVHAARVIASDPVSHRLECLARRMRSRFWLLPADGVYFPTSPNSLGSDVSLALALIVNTPATSATPERRHTTTVHDGLESLITLRGIRT